MVEVTKSNFKELFPHIAENIHASSFIAVDTEFTALELDSTCTSSLFDNLENRYQKLKTKASSILPCQIGISLFKKSKTENKYVVNTYVFFVRPYMIGTTDRKFVCQASSLDFLCAYDFDFNKFIKEGIPFVNEEELIQIQNEIKEKTISYNHTKMIDFKSKREIDMLINKKQLNNTETTNQAISNSSSKSTKMTLCIEKNKMTHEYFQVNELRKIYPSFSFYSDGDKIIIENKSVKNSKNDLNNLQTLQEKEDQMLIDYYLGFTKVFRCIRESSKPIIGHNLLMDLLLFYHNFYRPLPRTYKEFKRELHNLFPVIFDTRHIWLNVKKFYKLKDISLRCGLFDLFDMFKNPTDNLSTLFAPSIEHANCDKYTNGEFPHEAGFDSYVTGWVFLNICHVLVQSNVTNPVLLQPKTFKQHLMAVKPFENKINLSHSLIRYIDLIKDDAKPTKSQLLHISMKNKSKQLNKIQLSQLFDKYGLVEFKINSNRKEAIIAIGNLRSSQEILKDFQKDENFLVTEYSFLRHSFLSNTALWFTTSTLCVFLIIKYYPRS